MTATEPAVCRRLSIRGRVQGVCYRDWAIATARSLGLVGWVRNRRDGSVEALAAGPVGAIETFVAQCREGPPAARVETVDAIDEAMIEASGFTRQPTI
jgi:acylphosphatase